MNQIVYLKQITHNLWEMAQEAGIYSACWRPYELHSDFKEMKDYNEEMKFEEEHPML